MRKFGCSLHTGNITAALEIRVSGGGGGDPSHPIQ